MVRSTSSRFGSLLVTCALTALGVSPHLGTGECADARPALGESADSLTYPHVSMSDSAALANLQRLHAFVNANQNKGLVAVFDFDGTICSGEVDATSDHPSGSRRAYQGAWMVWGAVHRTDAELANLRLFPYLVTGSTPAEAQANILRRVDHLEDRQKYFDGTSSVSVTNNEYSKYTLLATSEAGMTPGEMTLAAKAFLLKYPPSRYAYKATLDIMQVLADAGFKVWIISASNPYFFAVVISEIERTMDYQEGRKYSFGAVKDLPYDPNRDQLVGNCAKLSPAKPDKRFTMIYDNRFVRGKADGKLRIVNGEGKRIALQRYIEVKAGAKAALVCGDSQSDASMMTYVLAKTVEADSVETFGVCIEHAGVTSSLMPALDKYSTKTAAIAAQ